MARRRTVKSTPKRGILTRREVRRAVDKVVRERLEREAREEQAKNPSPAVVRLRQRLRDKDQLNPP